MCAKRINEVRAFIHGYIYGKNYTEAGETTYWQCEQYRKQSCSARAITTQDPNLREGLIVRKGPGESKHNHPPTFDQFEEAKDFFKKKHKNKSRSSSKTKDAKRLTPLTATPAACASGDDQNSCMMGFMDDLEIYRRFLSKFLDNPRFIRENVMKILVGILDSEIKCLYAYATILENREKITKDIEALKIDADAIITALDETCLLNEAKGTEEICMGRTLEALNTHSEVTDKCSEKTKSLCREENLGELSKEEKFNEIPPMPPAIPIIRDAIISPTPTLRIDSIDDKDEADEKIELIDLTDDFDIKQNPTLAIEQTPMPRLQEFELGNTQADFSSTSQKFNSLTTVLHHSIPLCMMNPTTTAAGSQFPTLGGFIQDNLFLVQPSIPGVQCPSSVPPQFYSILQDSNMIVPTFFSNSQVPVTHDIQMNNGGQPFIGQFPTGIRIIHRPADAQIHIPSSDESKK